MCLFVCKKGTLQFYMGLAKMTTDKLEIERDLVFDADAEKSVSYL